METEFGVIALEPRQTLRPGKDERQVGDRQTRAMSEAQAVLVEDKEPTKRSEQREEDHMPDRIRRPIEPEKEDEMVDSSRLNRGFDSEVAARIAKVRQTIDRELVKRAESHREGFYKKGVQLRSTKTEPAHAEIPQAGSGIGGYQGTLET